MAPASTADKTGSEPVVAEQEKQREDAQAATPAPVASSQAPVLTPPISDEKAPPPSDSPAPPPPAVHATFKGDPTPNPGPSPAPVNEKAEEPAEEPAPTLILGLPEPDISEYERQLDFRRRKLLIAHTRLAKFFTWLLLLGFVVLPSTFGKTPQTPKGNQSDPTECLNNFNSDRNAVGNTALFPIGYVCCILNLLATCWLWHKRPTDARWLYGNLFFPGLTNAFSGVVTTLAGAFGARGGFHSPASKTTLAFALICTIVYGGLSLIYGKRATRQGTRRRSTASGLTV